jgi:hypothetical protein
VTFFDATKISFGRFFRWIGFAFDRIRQGPGQNVSCANMTKNRDRISGKNLTRKSLAKAIRRLYDPVLNEPLPQRLISTLRRKLEGGRPVVSLQIARPHAKKD